MFDPEWKHVYLDPRRGPTHFEYSKSLTTIFTDPCDSLTTWTTTASASIVAGGGYGSTNGLALGGAGNARWTIPSGSRSDRINASFRWKSSSLAVAHDICSWRTSGGTVNQLKLTSTTAGALTLLGGGAVIGTTADIPVIVRKHDVGLIMLAVSSAGDEDHQRILELCVKTNIRLVLVSDMMRTLYVWLTNSNKLQVELPAVVNQ